VIFSVGVSALSFIRCSNAVDLVTGRASRPKNMGVNHKGTGGTSSQNLDWGTLIQIVPQIFQKCRLEITKTCRFERKEHNIFLKKELSPHARPSSGGRYSSFVASEFLRIPAYAKRSLPFIPKGSVSDQVVEETKGNRLARVNLEIGRRNAA